MKRQAKPKMTLEYGPYEHYSIFSWEQCAACKKDFRREWGWRFLGPPYIGGAGHWYYLCKACAPSKDKARELIIGRVYMPKRPAPPRGICSGVVTP